VSVQIVTIELLGASFAVQTDESEEYLGGLVAKLRERLDGLRASTRVQDPLKLSILANITILDELLRAREAFGQKDSSAAPAGMRADRPLAGPRGALDAASGEEELSRVAARLIADLDRSLEG